ncbi:OmpA family protein [Chitinimonas arctica]|uniref:OmpA family protein n=1 Tax=Chitinimonas arctica TaxID=2594795 RepID=A0A516SIQ7_9NEIS|nr:OmpA family protein [Chitinimonas arctica]QDQ28040.1 OmpA family protein [Chitinimonas arctica]
MQKMKRTLVALALGTVAMSAFAAKDGYAIDGREAVVRNNYGECWRTNSWSKDKAIEECDAVAKKEVAAPVEAPRVVEAPKPTPVPVQVKMETLTLNAAALFEFNKAVLKEEGKQALDSVASVLLERKYDPAKTKIAVVGHTDRIGKESYNLKLSEERAAAARAQLVTKGVPEGMITSAGKGFSEPITKPEDCKKVLKNRKKLVACYAPDRRVEVEIYATVEK